MKRRDFIKGGAVAGLTMALAGKSNAWEVAPSRMPMVEDYYNRDEYTGLRMLIK
jgi:TAT (twin-arginine translocation) pathway signal sequence